MALSRPHNWQFVTIDGNVKRTGGGSRLAKGQLAIVQTEGATASGAVLVDSFAGLSKRKKIAIRLGKADVGVTRSLDNLSWESLPFTLDDVVELRVDAPKERGIKTDEFVIGFNGIDGTEIVLDNGDNEVFQLMLEGAAMGYLGYKDSCVTVQFQIEAPIEGTKSTAVAVADGWTDQEIIEAAVQRLKDYDLLGQNKLSDFVDIVAVNSESLATIPGTATNFYELTVADGGSFSDLARVQAAYPTLDIKVKEVGEGVTTYVAIGTATPGDFSVTLADLLKGCATCPAGYTELNDGFVYSVQLEDDGADQSAVVQGLPGAEAGSAVKIGQSGGTGSYSVVTDDELTEAEIAAFVTANPTAVVTLVSNDVAELCRNATATTTSWVQGSTCAQDVETWSITLRDDECGNSRLGELQRAFSDLTITETSVNDGCHRTYSADIVTNIVCEDCDPIYRDIFISEAPGDYDLVPWSKDPKQYNGLAKMGIKFKAKETIFSGSEQFRDDMPFIAESPRLRLVGGFPTNINESYNLGSNGRYTVKLLSRYEPPVNWGGNLRYYEDRSRVYFNGSQRHEGNNYAKLFFGEETNLDGTKQYVDYILRIHKRRYAQGWSGKADEGVDYHILVEVGRHEDVEDLLNELAAAAGVDTVQAYAKS